MRKVDIIIPIYNAYEDLVTCLESVYKNTSLDNNRLILINDNSPDERIKAFLDKQCRSNVIVIHNETNKGFSNNINIGMAQSEENDVILLNSDTIVTANWVEKLKGCAYRDNGIGTVTPLSNNATLCSVPEFCQENKLPDGMSVEQAGKIVEHCSMQMYPEITVAHGYCMYVKREVIDKIGTFDAETFEKGYGEENDFCNRAGLAGYHHVMCDDTYIYHSGTKSFISKEKQKYIQAHDEILRKRYPEQMKANDIHVRDNPNYKIGDNVGIYFKINNGKKNILYVVHSDFRKDSENHLGGTQLHVKDLVYELRKKYNVFVAARNGVYLNLTIYLADEEIKFRYYIGEKKGIYEFHNEKLFNIWENIINAFHINLIHVHHTLGLSFDIFYVARDQKIPIIFTVHDFYFICPTTKLFDYSEKICVGEKNADYCNKCLENTKKIPALVNYISVWREHCAEVFDICEQIVVPEESVQNIWKLYFPQFMNKFISIEHGYRTQERNKEKIIYEKIKFKIEKIENEGSTYRIIGWTLLNRRKKENVRIYLEIKNSDGKKVVVPTEQRKRIDLENEFDGDGAGFVSVLPNKILNNSALEIRVVICDDEQLIYSNEEKKTEKLRKKEVYNLNIAFIGGISREKGGKEITKIIRAMDRNVNWFIFGGIGEKSLESVKQKNLIKTGFYNREDLDKLLKLHEIDVIGIVSLLPETYSYTLTEAVLNRIPVIATNVGALGNRTRKLQCGWLISPNKIFEEFRDIIVEINEDNSKLLKYKENCELINIKSTRSMAYEYVELYEKYITKENSLKKANMQFVYSGYCGKKLFEELNSDTALEISELKRELAGIHSSIAYQYAYKLSTKNFPGRKKIRELLLKFTS